MRNPGVYSIAVTTIALSLAAAGAGYAVPIYINDEWGAAPVRSNDFSMVPYEGQVENRVYYNPQLDPTDSGSYSTAPIADDGDWTNGPDSVITGMENKEYFPISGITYQALAVGTPINGVDDPTSSAVESLSLTMGTDAFGNIGDAIYAIGSGAAPANVDRIVVFGGIYFESIIYPQNQTSDAATAFYYNTSTTYRAYGGGTFPTDLLNDDFDGVLQTGITIIGDPLDKPVITRGMVLYKESTDGLTVKNLKFAGCPGNPYGSGKIRWTGGNHQVVSVGATGWGSNTLPYPGLTEPGTRKDMSWVGCVFEGYGIRIPLRLKALPKDGSGVEQVGPAFWNAMSSAGGRGGVKINGEYGMYKATGNLFKGLRSFSVFDMNAASNNSATWADAEYNNNTIEDCWGCFSIRGEEPNNGGNDAFMDQIALTCVLENNTVRNFAENAIEIYSTTDLPGAPRDFVLFHKPNCGGAFKIFNVKEPIFRNNSIFRVNMVQDWYAKPGHGTDEPGDPGYVPMGAGLLIRDVRPTVIDPGDYTPPWADGEYTNAQIIGNTFDSCQQGIGVDPPTRQKFIPGGLASGNTFIHCRSGFYFYDGIISSQCMEISGNIFTDATDDPLGIGVGSGGDEDILGGVVFDENSLINPGEPPGNIEMDLSDNFFQGGPDGDNGIQNNSSDSDTSDGDQTIGGGNYNGDEDGEYLDAYPNLDSDGDGIADAAEDANGNGVVDVGETDPQNPDSDGDGLPDGTELRLGYDPTDINDPTVGGNGVDTDNDTIPDNVEIIIGTDPNLADSDGDRIRDDYELLVGSDPNDPNSYSSFGEANGTPPVNSTDAVRILAAFLDIETLDATNLNNVDINRDGVVNNTDAVILYQWSQNNIPYIPFP